MDLSTVLSLVNLGVILLAVLGGILYFGRRIGSIESHVNQVLHSIEAYMRSQGHLVGVLIDNGSIPQERAWEIVQPMYDAHQGAIRQLINRIHPGNPITQDEAQKLRDYADRAERGEPFTRQEAEDFYRLAKKVESEDRYKNDTGTVFLVGLAAFVLGLILGSKGNGAGS